MKPQYKLLVIAAGILFSLMNAHSQSQDQNYIRTRTMTNDAGTACIEQIQYFDGLGRLVETVQKKATTGQKDLISYQEYDTLGRESNTWLPVPATGNTGAFVPLNTLKTLSATAYAGDTKACSKNEYETSPLNRVVKQYGPGQNWHNNNKYVKTKYLYNSCLYFRVIGSGLDTELVTSGNYYNEHLFVTEITDENGYKSYEFKDKLGQVVLTRQVNEFETHDTYYVYDDYGNLCYVLSPMANTGATNLGDDSDNMKRYAYLYKYDERKRCVKKRLPGCDWVEYRYDDANRLIFSQDGEQRLQPAPEGDGTPGRWTINVCDALGRLVFVGESENPTITGVVSGTFEAGWPYHFGIHMSGLGFSWNNCKVHTVNYYDNYNFLSLPEFSSLTYENLSPYNTRHGSDTDQTAAKGLLTGTITALLDGSDGFIYTAYYYDYRGRLIQTKSTNHLGGIEKEYATYNFAGQPLIIDHRHAAPGKTSRTIKQTHTYDHAGRLKQKVSAVGSASFTKVITYNELGRLITTTTTGGIITNYQYNIRSWITSISNPLFQQNLSYSFNGNIIHNTWRNNNKQGNYWYEYDGLSRLAYLTFSDGGYDADGNGINEYYANFSGWYEYDKNGNITRMVRDYIDNLTLTYNGNQLKKVHDTAPNITLSTSSDFKNYVNITTEYAYNANGAMTQDLNKGISEIRYNSLNLPRQIDIVSPVAEARNEYIYSAAGQKLRLTQRYNPNFQTTPVIGSGVNESALTQTKVTDYVGSVVYENGVQKKILTDNGYYDPAANKFYSYTKDHQGNNRIVHSTGAVSSIVQQTDYYPFGMPFYTGITGQSVQAYKYNGKEFDIMHGLNLYDYSARQVDPAVGRFTTVDPLAEKYYNISPYAYCANNPVKYIDPDGKQIMLPPVLAGSNTPLLGAADLVKVGMRTGGGEALKAGTRTATEVGSKASESTGSKPTINLERINAGRQTETEQLQKLGLEKNTESITRIDPKTGKESTSVPDAIKDGGTKEIKYLKDGATQSFTKQLRIQKEFSTENGQIPQLHINRGANLSKPLQEAGFNVTRYSSGSSPISTMPQDNTKVNKTIKVKELE
ncbi:DUF6443 domain-containing protein [Viscerimonas tarda]